MTDRYAVFGNPIAQSKSPDIHGLFAKQTSQNILYTRFEPDPEGFAKAADEFFGTGGRGLNITMPFKHDAYEYANSLTPRARRAGAVNTLSSNQSGELLGDTTDGVGLIRDIVTNLEWPICAKRVLILGAGGAVRGVLEPVLKERPASLVIANRTESTAISLAKGFADIGAVEGVSLENLNDRTFDLIINGTSTGLSGTALDLPDTLLADDGGCYDMTYSANLTPFLLWGQARSTKLSDGLGMLVEQAAESFSLWRGVRPDTAPVIDAVRAMINEAD